MISLRDISCTFNPNTPLEVKALRNVSIEISAGDYIMIVGSNGSGKSTLLNLLAGSIRPNSGTIVMDQREITYLAEYKRSKMIARVFQNPFSGTASDLSILENFRLAALRTGSKKLVNGTARSFRVNVKYEISRLNLDLESNVDRKMGTLSGGQRQALTLLMAVMSPCKLLLMDEPCSALDPKTSSMVLRIADELIKQHQLTAIHITHQMKDAAYYGNRLLLMREGSIHKDLHGVEKQEVSPAELYEWFSY